MSKITGIAIAIVIVLGGILYFVNRPSETAPLSQDANTSKQADEQKKSISSQGRVIFSITDAAVDMNAISEINMTVSKVEMHSQTDGWITASSIPQTYSLLELNAKNEDKLLADIKAEAGTYDQVRLLVETVSVKTKAGATKTAKLPSGELKINTTLIVNADSISSANFDFMADKSLHMTGNSEYIFAPVVKTETKSDANVSIGLNSVVSIGSGHVDNKNTVGMDIDGNVKLDFNLKSDVKLDIGVDSVIKIKGGLLK